MDEVLKCGELYFHVVLLAIMFKVVLAFESEDEMIKCVHSHESYWSLLTCGTGYLAVQGGSNVWVCGWNPKVWWVKLSRGTVYFTVQGGSSFWVCGWNPTVRPFKLKLLSSTFTSYCLLYCWRWFKYSSLWNKSCSVTVQMKATEQHFPVVLFIKLHQVVLTFESVDEIPKCDHSNESYWAVLSCGTVYYAVESSSNFWVSGWNPKVWPFKCKLLSSTFLWYCLLSYTR